MATQFIFRYKLSLALVVLVLGSLACSLGGNKPANAVVIRKILPTFTPTGVAAPPTVSAQLVDSSTETQPGVVMAAPTAGGHLPALPPTPQATRLAAAPAQGTPVTSAGAVQPTATATPLPASTTTPATSTPPATVATPGATAAPRLPSDPSNPLPTLPAPSNPEPTPKSEVAGWSFRGVQTWLEEGNALVIGELINNTGSPQQGVDVSGTFYDRADQVIRDEIETLSHVPVDIVPVGAHIPFELVIESSQPIYRLDLLAKSIPASEPPRQDFQFSNVNLSPNETNLYCLEGQVQNPGANLVDYLVIMIVGYNDQGNVVNFGEYSPVAPEGVVGDQRSPFSMCLDPLEQQITRHELRAVGY